MDVAYPIPGETRDSSGTPEGLFPAVGSRAFSWLRVVFKGLRQGLAVVFQSMETP